MSKPSNANWKANSKARKPSVFRRSRLLLMPALFSLMYGCGGGGGCGGGCVNGYDYPQSELPNGIAPVEGGIRARMTQSALDFLSDNLRDIIVGSLGTTDPADPDTIRIDVGTFSLLSGGIDIAFGQSDSEVYPTTLLMSARDLGDRLTFEFVEGANQGIRVRAEDIPVGLDARLFTDVDLGITNAVAACDVKGSNASYGPGFITGITMEMLIHLDVGTGAQCDTGVPECLLINIDVVEANLDPNNTLGTSSITVDSAPRCNVSNPPANCSPECSDTFPVVDSNGDAECNLFCPVYDVGFDLVLGILDAFQPILSAFLDNILETGIRSALADFDGAPLSASDRMDLHALAGDLLREDVLDLGYSISPTGNAFDVNCPSNVSCEQTRGMDFILKSGFEAAPGAAPATAPGDTPDSASDGTVPHPCVNGYVGADFAQLYGNGEFIAPDTRPLDGLVDGDVYHFGLSMAKDTINQMLFGTYNTGAMCLELDTDGVHQLTGGAFPLSAGTLDLLTSGQLRQFADPNAPAIVTVTPNTPPVFTFGAGTQEEGHIIMSWADVDIDFYVLVYERPVRIFSVRTQISAALSVFEDPDTETLSISVVDGPNIDQFEQRYNELLPDVNFNEVLDSLLGLAFDALLGNGLDFQLNLSDVLTSAFGANIYVDFQGIETVASTQGGPRDYLNVYFSMTNTPPSARTYVPPVHVALADDPGLIDTLAHPTLPGVTKSLPTGQVRLQGSDVYLDAETEYFVQVDFGVWRGPLHPGGDGTLLVKDGKLGLIGQHQIRLRGRQVGAPNTLAKEATELSFWVDPAKPKVRLQRTEDSVLFHGSDIGTESADLEYRWRSQDGIYTDWSTQSAVALDILNATRRLEVQARDRAGNVSNPVVLDLAAGPAGTLPTVRTVVRTAARVEHLAEPMAAAQGCASTSSNSLVTTWALLAMGLFLGRRRRQMGR